MRDMEERGVGEEESEGDGEESDVIRVLYRECVCVRERESVCVFTIDRFFFHRI